MTPNTKIMMLDCTLRDGGYINDWQFGEHTIKDVIKRLGQTGVEAIEVGFIKPEPYDKNRTVFSNTDDIKTVIGVKNPDVLYVGMLDMSAPVPLESISQRSSDGVDALRVIFKKDKIDEGYAYCKAVKERGYVLFVQPVGADLYSDEEFITMIKKFNTLEPDILYIVDSFGVLKRKHFLRLVYLADNNLNADVRLGYHSHNNLQQAFSNAEAMTELNLKRDIIIDACVFGMGRGAGNLNMELFAGYLNENYGKCYRIEPMLEITDLYLNDIYKIHFWGYSMPFYLSATNSCHPNYAIYFEKKGTLTAKSFNEVLRSIPADKKAVYSADVAESIYQEYQRNFIDDSKALKILESAFIHRKVLLLAPGKTLATHKTEIQNFIDTENPIVVCLNYYDNELPGDYVFWTNARRFNKKSEIGDAVSIITSNVRENIDSAIILNYSSYECQKPGIMENSGLMFLNILISIGIKDVYLAGMDGYKEGTNFFTPKLDAGYSSNEMKERNILLTTELKELGRHISIHYLTPSLYQN